MGCKHSKQSVFVLEAITSDRDSPFQGPVIAFAGRTLAETKMFMAMNPDFVQSDEADCWEWRVTQIPVADIHVRSIVYHFDIECQEIKDRD